MKISRMLHLLAIWRQLQHPYSQNPADVTCHNKSKKLHENREHKCTLCNETVQQYHTNLENHFQEKHNLTALDYFKKYVAGLKEEHIPSEDEEEDGDDSEFIEAM